MIGNGRFSNRSQISTGGKVTLLRRVFLLSHFAESNFAANRSYLVPFKLSQPRFVIIKRHGKGKGSCINWKSIKELPVEGCMTLGSNDGGFKDGWQSRWVKSEWKISEGKDGSFENTAGK